MPPPVCDSSGGCPAVWFVSHHRGYCSPESTVRSPHPCGSSCEAPLYWQAAPSSAVYGHACHQLLPWLMVTFAGVPDAAGPGSDQWPWSTGPATGPVGGPGRHSASDPGAVDPCVQSLCRPRCVCVCGVLAHLAPVQRCARSLSIVRGISGHVALVHRRAHCVRCAFAVGVFVPPPPPLPPFFCFSYVLCICFCFPPLLSFVFQMQKEARAHCRHRHAGKL